jgi:hypothetical protein
VDSGASAAALVVAGAAGASVAASETVAPGALSAEDADAEGDSRAGVGVGEAAVVSASLAGSDTRAETALPEVCNGECNGAFTVACAVGDADAGALCAVAMGATALIASAVAQAQQVGEYSLNKLINSVPFHSQGWQDQAPSKMRNMRRSGSAAPQSN